MVPLFRKITTSDFFHRVILFLILLTAAAMGVEAVSSLNDMYGDFLYNLDVVVQTAFVIEITLRLLAEAPRIGNFFKDRWNTFDFAVVALSLVPAIGSFALIGRLFRLLRVLRMLSVSNHMRNFMARLQQTFDEVAGAAVIVIIVGYIFVIGGHYLFDDIDPVHWGDLKQSLLSVFYLLLFQNVPGFVEPLVAQSLFSLLYFAAFYLVFIGLGLCVIVASVMQEREKSP
jgi:voltage-gated sodium channel